MNITIVKKGKSGFPNEDYLLPTDAKSKALYYHIFPESANQCLYKPADIENIAKLDYLAKLHGETVVYLP